MKKKPESIYNNCSGNVLFLILIAVVLFGALGYAVSNSTRTNSSNINADKNKIDAAQIVEACADLRNTAMRFMFTGVSDSELLVNDGTSTTNPCKTGTKCLFAKEGGAAIIPIPPQVKGSSNGKFALPPTQAVYYFYNISNGSYLTGYESNKPLVIFEAFPLDVELCKQINVALGRDATPTSSTVVEYNFRDACYINTNNSYLFRCPLTR